MVFSESVFLFYFLPWLLLAYFTVPVGARNTLLLVASLAFYAWGERQYTAVMLVSILINYAFGLGVARGATSSGARVALWVGMACNLTLLGAMKYANFAADNLNVLLTALSLPTIDLPPVHLPIGISFFTFQGMSYVVDVYRGVVPAQRNPLKIALYLALFPQLIAGPIVRYVDVAREIDGRRVTGDGFASGARRFVVGLGKKLIVADVVAGPADTIFALPPGELTTGLAWLGVACYTLQIYYDFSAYSDMAIGLGRMFGFHFLENFNYPYTARSMTDFWRRWHISLSTWFRDYLYIPLGGNRRGRGRTYVNLLIVFLLCGLWHGASWNFVIWGLLHGVFLAGERLLGLDPVGSGPAPGRRLYVLLGVMVAWVFFRAETFGSAWAFVSAMAGFAGGDGRAWNVGLLTTREVWLVMAIGAIGSTPFVPWIAQRLEPGPGPTGRATAPRGTAYDGTTPGPKAVGLGRGFAVPALRLVILAAIFLYSAMLIAAGSYSPFIYFRF